MRIPDGRGRGRAARAPAGWLGWFLRPTCLAALLAGPAGDPAPSAGGGDPLCELDGRGPGVCCAGVVSGDAGNETCWRRRRDRGRFSNGLQEFHTGRCCYDVLGGSALRHGQDLPKGLLLQLLGPESPAVVLVRGVPGLGALLRAGAAEAGWFDTGAWPRAVERLPQRNASSLQLLRLQESHQALARLLWDVASRLLRALARDLRAAGPPGEQGGRVLEAAAARALLVHVRHRVNQRPWAPGTHRALAPRYGEVFGLHRDRWFVTVQTRPTLGGEAFEDGTFAIGADKRMHRVRLGPDDVALFVGDAVEELSDGLVRAAQHEVLVHRSYRGRLAAGSPRQVTMFHVHPESREKAPLVELAALGGRCEHLWSSWVSHAVDRSTLFSDLCLPPPAGPAARGGWVA